MWGRVYWLALATVAAMLAAPSGAAAFAAEAHLSLYPEIEDATLVYADTSGSENDVTVGKSGGTMSLRDPGAEISVPSWAGPDTNTYCTIASSQIQCRPPAVYTYRSFFVALWDGEDVVKSTAGGAFFGGAGDDKLVGGTFMVGGPGADDFVGISTRPPSASVDYSQGYPTEEAGVTVSLDNVANDGHDGEGDNVHTSVADVYGTHAGNDTIVGNAHANSFSSSAGNDRLYGRGGKDFLDAGYGADLINGGPGKDDLLLGGPGNDVLWSRDGERDRVRCEGGIDRAIVDSLDTVGSCETVRVG